MIDSGSEASLISQNIIDKFPQLNKHIIKVNRVTLIGPNQKKLYDVNKMLNINLEFNEKNVLFQLLIVPNMPMDIVIGSDYLNKYKAKIDYETRKLCIDDIWVEFKKDRDEFMYIKGNEQSKVGFDEGRNEKEMYFCGNDNYYDDEVDEEIFDINKIKINVNDNYESEVRAALKKYERLVSNEMRVAESYVHRLEVRDITNFKEKTYPIPYMHKEKVKIEIGKLLKDGIIERSNTPYINPLVIVTKKSGEIRICLDARTINKYTVPQYEAPLMVDAILGRITNAKIFSKLDLKHSFWLIPLDEESRKYTGFTVDGEIFHFKTTPFGLQSSCSALVRALHNILNKYDKFVLHYIDDILIYSDNIDNHRKHLDIVLYELDKNGLKLNIDKCQFYKQQVTYLGYQINQTGIQMDEDRIQTIKQFKRPNNLKTLRGFLGMINYFKRIIPDLTAFELPLIELLKKNVRWTWTETQQKAFDDLKNIIIDKLKIYHPNYNLPFTIRTDASIHRLAGVLLQTQDDIEVPISFTSRVTKKHERNYSVSELELASIIFTITKMRFYLLGNKFIVQTDNQALTSILNNKYGNNRIHRWAVLLNEYNFDIQYIPGKTNILADALTRMDERQDDRNVIKIGINVLKDNDGLFSNATILLDQQKLTDNDKKKLTVKDQIYIKKIKETELYAITNELTKEIVRRIHHDYGHVGIDKTWTIYRETYYNKQDRQITKNIIKTCHICQLAKDKNRHYDGQPKSIRATRPRHKIAIDFISNLITSYKGSRHIFLIVDIFSKYVRIYPCRKTNTKTVIHLLNRYVQEEGQYDECILDNATYFRNDRIQNYFRQRQTRLHYTSIRHPQANPAERYVKEVSKYLRMLVFDEQPLWEDYLTDVEKYLNHIPNNVTDQSPITIFKNEQPDRPWTITTNTQYKDIIQKVNERLQRAADKYHRRMTKTKKNLIKYEKGDLVIVKTLRVPNRKDQRCAKLMLPYDGPYMINTTSGTNSYELKYIDSDRTKGIYNVTQLHPYYKDKI